MNGIIVLQKPVVINELVFVVTMIIIVLYTGIVVMRSMELVGLLN